MNRTAHRPLVRRERDALADLLDAGGPSAPTVLPGWDASDLLEHLILREQRPDLLIGPKLPVAPLARSAKTALEALRALPWEQRVARFRHGPQVLSPVRLLDEAVNTLEYFIHHEDLRRAHDMWEPRELSSEDRAQLWSRVRRMARLLVKAPVDVVLMSPLGAVHLPARRAHGAVAVTGSPGELLLWAFGREHAQVSVQGEDSALRSLEDARRGF